VCALSDALLEEAEQACEQAVQSFHWLGNQHAEAIALMALALTREQRPAKCQLAIQAYGQSLEILKELQERAQSVGKKGTAQFYLMLQNDAGYRLHTLASHIGEAHGIPPTPESQAQPSTKQRAGINSSALSFLPVIGPIPAGQKEISTDDIQDTVIAAADQMTIDGTQHYIRRLRGGGGLIRLSWRQNDYCLSRVKGSSMNLAEPVSIDDGNYVILARSRDVPVSPKPHDIVAASILGVDAEVTLKRYIQEGDTFILQPESSDPQIASLEFREGDEQVNVVGIAVAVLKAIE
jgi:SOS-response transcriptional repressor LexA